MRFHLLRSCIAAIVFAATLPAGAITVDSAADGTLATLAGNGTCDLREAVMAINMGASVAQCTYDGATITFAAALAGQTIALTTDAEGWCAWSGYRLAMCKSAVISSAAGQVTLDFQGRGGFVFAPVENASAKIIVALRGVKLTGAGVNGAVLARANITTIAPEPYGVDLTLNTVAVVGNAANAYGGGININSSGLVTATHRGALVIHNSLFANNAAAWDGGAVFAFGPASINIANTTFHGNTAGGANHMGGAIAVYGVATGPLSFDHATVTGNSAGWAGGMAIGPGFDVRLSNSIVAGNTAETGPHDLSGRNAAFASTLTASHNLLGSLDPAVLAQVQAAGGNITSFPVLTAWLGALADNGGPTQTRALLNVAGNPALDAGDDTLGGEGADQRGAGFARTSGAHTDIGAFEYQVVPLVATTTTPQPTTMPFGQSGRIYVLVAAASPSVPAPTGAVTVTVTAGPSTGATCTATLAALPGNGQAQGMCDLPVGTYPVGGYTVTAAYGGDTVYASSSGTGVSQIIQQEILPEVTPPASPTVLTAGASYDFAYGDLYFAYGPGPIVTPPTGTFTVTTDEGQRCTLPIHPTGGSCPLRFNTPGRHEYFIAYAGDAGHKQYPSEQVYHVDVAPAAAVQTPLPVPALSPWAALLLATALALTTAWVVRTRMR